MVLLKIKMNVPMLSEQTSLMPELSSLIRHLFFPMGYFERKECRETIQQKLSMWPLSNSLRLVFPVFIELVRRNGDQQNKFFDNIGSFKLNEFLRKKHQIEERLFHIKQKRANMLCRSYSFLKDEETVTLSDLLTRDQILAEEEAHFEWLASFPMMSFIIEIVQILEEAGRLPEERCQCIQSELIHDLQRFIRKLAPLFCAVQNMALDKQGVLSMSGLDTIIDETLTYLGCSEERPLLAFQIKEKLFEKKYLERLEAPSLDEVDSLGEGDAAGAPIDADASLHRTSIGL